jgi:hypothetical protein
LHDDARLIDTDQDDTVRRWQEGPIDHVLLSRA